MEGLASWSSNSIKRIKGVLFSEMGRLTCNCLLGNRRYNAKMCSVL